jgi:hypothetical protein
MRLYLPTLLTSMDIIIVENLSKEEYFYLYLYHANFLCISLVFCVVHGAWISYRSI